MFTAKQQREHAIQRRAETLERLGNQCVHCGFSDSRALQIDHKHGNGKKERVQLKQNRIAFYKQVALHPELYQILCANCNWIKRAENHEYKAT